MILLRATPRFQPTTAFGILRLRAKPSLQRSFHRRQNHSSTYRSVQIQRRIVTTRRFVSWFLYPIATLVFLRTVFAKLDEIPDEDGEDDEGRSEAVEIDEDGNIVRAGDMDSIFIPMQFPQKLPVSFYKGSDPEWREFVKFSKDHERTKAVRKELAGLIGKELAAVPQVSMRLGKNIIARKYWLDIRYPDSPPPEYERSGLEFNDDYIAWSTQTIPQSTYVQLRKLLWPRAVFGAAVKSIKMLYYLQKVKVKSMLGMQFTQWDQQVAQLSMLTRNTRNPGGTSQPNDLSKPDEVDSVTEDLDSNSSLDTTKHPDSNRAFWMPGRPSIPKMPNDMVIASAMFMNTLNQLWRSANVAAVPKGCFFVVGMVELMGSRGRCVIDVNAAYDPKAGKYVAISANARHFWVHKQSPRGGP